jgi:hypothetical protein
MACALSDGRLSVLGWRVEKVEAGAGGFFLQVRIAAHLRLQTLDDFVLFQNSLRSVAELHFGQRKRSYCGLKARCLEQRLANTQPGFETR